jgi:hypothetical protein
MSQTLKDARMPSLKDKILAQKESKVEKVVAKVKRVLKKKK